MPDDGQGKKPAYQWYPRDHAADEHVQLMTLEEEGAYRRLLDHQWFHGSIPADVAQLARICRNVPTARMRRIWKAVAPCFVPAEGEPGRLQNRRLERVRTESREYRERQSTAGRLGAEARWGPRRRDGQTDGRGDGGAIGGASSGAIGDRMAGGSPGDGSASAAASASAVPPSVGPVDDGEPVAIGPEAERLLGAFPSLPDRWAAHRFLERCPPSERHAWASRLLGYLNGLGFSAGMQPTPAQLATACSDYSQTPPNPIHFRAFVLRVMRGEPERRTGSRARASGEQQLAVARDWANGGSHAGS